MNNLHSTVFLLFTYGLYDDQSQLTFALYTSIVTLAEIYLLDCEVIHLIDEKHLHTC